MGADHADDSLLRAKDIIHLEIIASTFAVTDQALATGGWKCVNPDPEFDGVARCSDFLEAGDNDSIGACGPCGVVERICRNEARLAQQHPRCGGAVVRIGSTVSDGGCSIIEPPVGEGIIGQDPVSINTGRPQCLPENDG